MSVTSLFALRQQLRTHLAAMLPGVEVLTSLPAARRPLPEDAPVLVIGIGSLRRAQPLLTPAQDGLLLEVGLTLTVFHRDSSEACEEVTEALSTLALQPGFPYPLLQLQSECAEYSRTLGAFSQRTACTLTCLVTAGEEDA